MPDLNNYSKVINELHVKDRERFVKELNFLNKQSGKIVHHKSYLLDGVIIGGHNASFTLHPMVHVKWYNEAETIEFLDSLCFLEFIDWDEFRSFRNG